MNLTEAEEEEAFGAEMDTAVVIRKVWTTCLLLLGTFGNIATIFTMQRIKGNHSQQTILTALAVVDQTLLSLGATHDWLRDFFQQDVRDLHTAVCKVQVWLVYTCATVSAWLVTAVTVLRTIAVTRPHRARTMCTVRRTRMTIAGILLASGLLQLHPLLGKELAEDDRCGWTSSWYEDFFHGVWTLVDMCLTSALPSLCLFVCNAILSLAIRQGPVSMKMNIRAISHGGDPSCNNSRRKRAASKTTGMILTLSCTFLLLTLPVCVFFIWEFYWFEEILLDPDLEGKAEIAYVFTSLLWYTNSAVNFLLYCITGTRFRKEFVHGICCKRGSSLDSSGASYRQESSQRGGRTVVEHTAGI